MRKDEKKTVIISFIGVILLVVAVLGASYAVWAQTFLGSKQNSITTGSISFTYDEDSKNANNVIAITNAVPVSDDVGKVLAGVGEQFNFSVSADYKGVGGINYEIYLTPEATNTVDSKYIKLYLTDSSNVAKTGFTGTVPTFASLSNSSSNSGSKILYIGKLNSSGVADRLRLRAWLSSDYDITETAQSFVFKVNVNASV